MKKILIIMIASLILVLSGCNRDSVEEIEFIVNAGQDTVEINASWEDEGAVLYVDDNIYNATASGTVNTAMIGLYTIEYLYTYDEEDFFGIRYVNVVDQTNPVIVLLAGIDTIVVGDTWEDAGATVLDNSLEELTLIISGVVDESTVGVYEVVYSATDSSGNTSSITRYVNIIN